VVDIHLADDGKWVIKAAHGDEYLVAACVMATGTFLNAHIIVGLNKWGAGPDNLKPSTQLAGALETLGIETTIFKTGTPARIHRRSVDFAKLAVQNGDDEIVPMSFETEYNYKGKLQNKVVCHIAYTNERTHEIIRQNLDKSPLYNGMIEGVGPRYCPSIEDKIVRFADKPRHQLFIEPMGMNTDEMYIQGFSSSMPSDVQTQMIRSIEGLENAEVMRPGYAIEYVCVNPMQLKATLEYKRHRGLFSCGQINGTSGYEEAAAQGIIAGINAALYCGALKGDAQNIDGAVADEFILRRDEAYIGVLIDDLITKGTNEPYRMMTARAEFRLLLRQDNADFRLTEKGYNLGLISSERKTKFDEKWAVVKRGVDKMKRTTIAPREINNYLDSVGEMRIENGVRAAELLKRPKVSYHGISEALRRRDDDAADSASDVGNLEEYSNLKAAIEKEIEVLIKYEGYISKQISQVEQFKKLEAKKLPKRIDYSKLLGLRLEARQKLQKVAPETVGQAMRISGVSPADIAVLLAAMKVCPKTASQ
jgi:tRNA uridine 5-carboxymethylaminomethyl modification enzyme